MFYDFDLPIPANTPADDPAILDVELTHGIIHRVEIEFPGGCAGLVYVAIRQALHQLWPLNPGGAFHSDSHTIAWDDRLPWLQVPYNLQLVGWSLDDIYPHTIPVRIGILPADILEAPQQSVSLLQRLLRRMGL